MITPAIEHTNRVLPVRTASKKTALTLLFFYPALLSLLFSFIVSSHFVAKEVAENFLFATLLLLAGNLLRPHWLRLLYLLAAVLFLYLTAFVETGYFYLYRNAISESTIFIMLETNASEAGDFFTMYFDGQLLALSILLLLPLLFALFFLFRFLPASRSFLIPTAVQRRGKKPALLWSVCLLLLLCAVLFKTSLRQRNIVYVTFKSWRTYRAETAAYQLLSDDKFGGKFSGVSSMNPDEEELYVMVIGEATTRRHMSLYNYYRATNPLLSARKRELDVFTNIISPHTHTILSLQKVLTLANYENPEAFKDGSMLQLMNKAGFQTYWISNQSPIGANETLVTKLAKAAGKTYFTNAGSWSSVSPYDEKLMAPFKKVLSEKGKKKFIVLHLLGTHGKYYKRYPKSFAKFTDTPQTVFKHDKAYSFINQYDNAFLYNDYIVSQMIDLVKKENKKSWLLYFSDHGEDVFETVNTATHQDVGGTKAMYDIPFLVWRSDKYKQSDKHQYLPERKYMTDDLIYTVADMSGVRFSAFDSTRSLVSPLYSERKRRIGKTDDYDEKFGSP